MTDLGVAYFRDSAGKITPTRLPRIEAVTATQRHPHEWSLDPERFAPVPEGRQLKPPGTHPGGRGRILGASVYAD